MTITVVVPGCPSPKLRPNQGASKLYKSGDAAQHRGDAKYAAIAILHDLSVDLPLFTGPVAVEAHVCWAKYRQVHDLDAVAIMCKPFLDGLTDAEVWKDDRQMERYTVTQEPFRTSKTTGQVILTVEAIEKGRTA